MTVESFAIEEGLEEETLLLPPDLDLDVDSSMVSQRLAPDILYGLALLPLHHLDVVQGFRHRAGAEVLPVDAALVFHAAVEIALVPALLPGHVYYLPRRAPEVTGPHCEERLVPRTRSRQENTPRHGSAQPTAGLSLDAEAPRRCHRRVAACLGVGQCVGYPAMG